MKTVISEKQQVYAVAYRYGKNDRGTYISVVVGGENASARSPFSVFGDKKVLSLIGVDQKSLDYPESGSQLEELERPIPLYEAFLCTTQHAPVKINDRTYRSLSFVVTNEAEASEQANYLVQRRFDQATGFFKINDDKIIADYKAFVLGEAVDADQLLAWLKDL